MTMLYPLALLMLFAAVTLLAANVVPAQARTLAVRGVQFRRGEVSRLPSIWFRWLFPLLDRMAPWFRGIPWRSYRIRAATALQRAGLGDVVTVDHLLAFKALVAIVAPLLISRLFAVFSNPALFLLTGLGAFHLPDRLVNEMRRAREADVVRALPGAVDVLSLSVEAGLEFLTAIQRLVERGGIGALRDELATILNDIRLGKSRADALKAFSSRVEVQEVASFVSVLVQADMLGASIGPVLKSQAERMRVERFQRAEKAGARASQKILFPLVLFIFPAVLIVIIGPVILQFMYGG
jgi:tight adherence protein C